MILYSYYAIIRHDNRTLMLGASMTKLQKIEQYFFLSLAILSLVGALLCLPFVGAKFGAFFFFCLCIGCAVMYIMLRIANSGSGFAKGAKIIAMIGRIAFLVWLVSFFIIQICIAAGGVSTDEKTLQKADYIIVLGAGLHGEIPSATLTSRLEAALGFLNEHLEVKAVLCGGQGPGESISEALAMRRWLEARNIDPNRLMMEDSSTNTLQNVSHAKSILDKLEGDNSYSVAVVTNEFHLFRSKNIMKQAGFAVCGGVAAQTPYAYLRFVYSIREYFSITGLMVTGRFV